MAPRLAGGAIAPLIRWRFHATPTHAVEHYGQTAQWTRHANGIVRKIDTGKAFFMPELSCRASLRPLRHTLKINKN
jgi:hypothetical protein